MKLCFVGNAAMIHARMRAEAFAKRGHEVTLLSRDSYAPGMEGVRFWTPERGHASSRIGRAWESLEYMIRYFQAIREADADFYVSVYCAGYGPWLLHAAGKHPHMAVAIGSDAYHEENGRPPREGELTDALYRGADLIVAESPRISERLKRLGGIGNVHTMAWGVHVDKFTGFKEVDVRAMHGLDEGAPLVFAPRGVSRVYAPEKTLQAFAKLVELRPDARMIMLGSQDAQTPEGRIRELAHTLEIADKVVFPGRIPFEDMAGYYASADVVLSTSTADGTPHSVLEAAVCGTPVVLTDLPHYQGVFAHEENALFSDGTPADYATQMLRLIEDRELASRLADACKAMALKEMDFDKNVARAEGWMLDYMESHKGKMRRTSIQPGYLIAVVLTALGILH